MEKNININEINMILNKEVKLNKKDLQEVLEEMAEKSNKIQSVFEVKVCKNGSVTIHTTVNKLVKSTNDLISLVQKAGVQTVQSLIETGVWKFDNEGNLIKEDAESIKEDVSENLKANAPELIQMYLDQVKKAVNPE